MKRMLLVSKDNYWTKNLVYHLKTADQNHEWKHISNVDDLNSNLVAMPVGEKIFFFHWSERISNDVLDGFECIIFHTGNLPLERGGSPIQNAVNNDVLLSKVNALRATSAIDAGPIYCSRDITLSGTCFDIWMTISRLAFGMIMDILYYDLEPVQQKDPLSHSAYHRICGGTQDLNRIDCLPELYNRIRVLDCESYPNFSFESEKFVIELSRAKFDGEKIICDAKIMMRNK